VDKDKIKVPKRRRKWKRTFTTLENIKEELERQGCKSIFDIWIPEKVERIKCPISIPFIVGAVDAKGLPMWIRQSPGELPPAKYK